MKTKHTPGPWEVLDNAILSEKLNKYGNWIVCDCKRENTEEDKANLRLLSAAPDLLEACKRAAWLTEGMSSDPDSYETWKVLIAAIAKAEGGE